MLLYLVEQAQVCLFFYSEDVAGLHAVAPESVWKPLSRTSGYRPRETPKKGAYSRLYLRVCAVFFFVSWLLAQVKDQAYGIQCLLHHRKTLLRLQPLELEQLSSCSSILQPSFAGFGITKSYSVIEFVGVISVIIFILKEVFNLF